MECYPVSHPYNFDTINKGKETHSFLSRVLPLHCSKVSSRTSLAVIVNLLQFAFVYFTQTLKLCKLKNKTKQKKQETFSLFVTFTQNINLCYLCKTELNIKAVLMDRKFTFASNGNRLQQMQQECCWHESGLLLDFRVKFKYVQSSHQQ